MRVPTASRAFGTSLLGFRYSFTTVSSHLYDSAPAYWSTRGQFERDLPSAAGTLRPAIVKLWERIRWG